MIRKVLAWPVVFVGKLVAGVGIFSILFGNLIKGKSLDKIGDELDLGVIGLKASANEDNAIIELVEKHYGSGKAMQVAEILEQGE